MTEASWKNTTSVSELSPLSLWLVVWQNETAGSVHSLLTDKPTVIKFHILKSNYGEKTSAFSPVPCRACSPLLSYPLGMEPLMCIRSLASTTNTEVEQFFVTL